MSDPDFISASVLAGHQVSADTERAWAAGFFDGEGWIGVSSAKNGHTYLKIAVVQTELSTLERFNRIVGGAGRIYERTKYQPAHWSPSWVLQINTQGGVIYAVNIIWPYLSGPKCQQISAAFGKRATYRSSWPAAFKLPQQRLSDDDVREIRQLRTSGMSRKDVATKFGVHVSSVSCIMNGTLRGNVI